MSDERHSEPPNCPAHPKPIRFSLKTLFFVVTVLAVVFAGFAWDPVAGIFIYLACFTLIAAILRGRAACQRYDAIRTAGGNPGSVAVIVVASGAAVALATAIAFCGTCSLAQVPFVSITTVEHAREAEVFFARGLLVSIPLGTFAAIFVYALTWPPPHRKVPPRE